MTRIRIPAFPLPLFLLAAVVVAITAFGLTRFLVQDDAGALAPLEVAGDTAAAAPGAMDLNNLFRQRVDTSVTIRATIGGEPMNGAGVVVHTDGTIVTASHVIKDYEQGLAATQVVVSFHKGDEVEAEVLAIDQFNDLAILKVDPAEVRGGVVAAPLGNSDKVLVGASVAAIGAPYGYEWSITDGHVSATHRVIGSRINLLSKIPDAIQFDAAINQGNSGGPVFNARGEVIGISQQIASKSESSAGIAFAVSSNIVARALRVHRQTGAAEIPYADLGISAVDLTPQLAAEGQLTASKGALVQAAQGPAAAAGIAAGREVQHLDRVVRMGDVIVGLAGQEVEDNDDLLRIAAAIDAEAPVEIVYLRGNERIEATIDPSRRQVV